MECKCGASLKDAQAVSRKADAIFDYAVCRGCGRNDYGTLTVAGKVIATGSESQRLFLAMTEEAPEQPATPVIEPDTWTPATHRPMGDGLIKVRFAAGGHSVERPSFFEGRWDLIDAWQPYDNASALAASFNPQPIPPALRVGEPVPEPKRASRPTPIPPPQPDVQRGMTFSLF
jgi:hypothetical protein